MVGSGAAGLALGPGIPNAPEGGDPLADGHGARACKAPGGVWSRTDPGQAGKHRTPPPPRGLPRLGFQDSKHLVYCRGGGEETRLVSTGRFIQAGARGLAPLLSVNLPSAETILTPEAPHNMTFASSVQIWKGCVLRRLTKISRQMEMTFIGMVSAPRPPRKPSRSRASKQCWGKRPDSGASPPLGGRHLLPRERGEAGSLPRTVTPGRAPLPCWGPEGRATGEGVAPAPPPPCRH